MNQRSRAERFWDWVVRWMTVAILVTSTPLWFLQSKHSLNKNDAWTFVERFRAASIPIVIFVAGWLWCKHMQRRKQQRWVDKAVAETPVWKGVRQR